MAGHVANVCSCVAKQHSPRKILMDSDSGISASWSHMNDRPVKIRLPSGYD